MRAPVSSLRSLVQLRAGVVADPFPTHYSPAGREARPRRFGGAPDAPAKAGLSPRIARVAYYLVPLLLAAALTACDGAAPTEPEATGSVLPGRTTSEGRPDRPNHILTGRN